MAASDSFVSTIYADALSASSRRNAASRELFRSCLTLLESLVDFAAAFGCTFAILSLNGSAVLGADSARHLVVISLAAGLAVALSLRSMPLRHGSWALLPMWETERVLRATLHGACLLLVADLIGVAGISAKALFATLIALPASLICVRQAFTSTLRALSVRGYAADRVVICGAAATARHIAFTLMHAPRPGLCPVALILDENAAAATRVFTLPDHSLHGLPISRGPVSATLLRGLRCDLLIVAAARLSPQQIEELRDMAEQARSSIAVLHDASLARQWMHVDGLALDSSRQSTVPWYFALVKRIADVGISLALLFLLAPLMFAIALLIRFDSPGPVLFVQKRVGRNGRLFPMFKFRSLHVTAPAYERSPTDSRDPRITRMGRVLRRAGLDELPQLVNVLLGHMSLVGPRPEMPFLVDRYRSAHRPRLQVTPGITGLWQLSADRGLPIHENPQHDLYYIRYRTLCMDWAILIHTLFFALRGGS